MMETIQDRLISRSVRNAYPADHYLHLAYFVGDHQSLASAQGERHQRYAACTDRKEVKIAYDTGNGFLNHQRKHQ